MVSRRRVGLCDGFEEAGLQINNGESQISQDVIRASALGSHRGRSSGRCFH